MERKQEKKRAPKKKRIRKKTACKERRGWKPPTGKALKKLQEDWDHCT